MKRLTKSTLAKLLGATAIVGGAIGFQLYSNCRKTGDPFINPFTYESVEKRDFSHTNYRRASLDDLFKHKDYFEQSYIETEFEVKSLNRFQLSRNQLNSQQPYTEQIFLNGDNILCSFNSQIENSDYDEIERELKHGGRVKIRGFLIGENMGSMGIEGHYLILNVDGRLETYEAHLPLEKPNEQ